MIKGRAEENASLFIFTIIALAITRVIARSRCAQTSPTSFVVYGKRKEGKVHRTYSYGSPRGLVHVHVFTHFSSVLNLHFDHLPFKNSVVSPWVRTILALRVTRLNL